MDPSRYVALCACRHGWGGVGWGGASVNVHVNLQGQWIRLGMWRYVHVDMGGVGWGGASVNVHVNLQGQWIRLGMWRYVHVDMGGVGWGGVGHLLTFM